jgi:hypothetical protein
MGNATHRCRSQKCLHVFLVHFTPPGRTARGFSHLSVEILSEKTPSVLPVADWTTLKLVQADALDARSHSM